MTDSPRALPSPIFQAAHPQLVLLCCVALLLCSTLLQKFAVPGFAGLLSISLVTLIGAGSLFAMVGQLTVNVPALFCYCIFVAVTSLGLLIGNTGQVSYPSWLLLCLVQTPLIFRFIPGAINYTKLLNFVSALSVVFGIAGVLQLLAQYLVGSRIAFALDYNMPPAIALKGYNSLNPLVWDVDVFKSNGVVFAEPSYFSQFLAIGLLAEFLGKARIVTMLIIGVGLLSSYSGTGLMTLAFFALFYVPPSRRLPIALASLGVIVVLVIFGQYFGIGMLTSRVTEILEPGSSGYARFISIFSLIHRIIFADPLTFVFGRGPGTVSEFYESQAFGTFDPTWGKLFYEYGAMGTAAYVAFFYAAVIQHRTRLGMPLAFTYFLLGGYLLDAAVIAQLAVLAAWPATAPNSLEAERTPSIRRKLLSFRSWP